MMPKYIDNTKRVLKIKRLLGLKGNDTESEYYRVADVLCDLRHFCDSKGIEFDDEMQSAINYYQSECIEKEIKNDI